MSFLNAEPLFFTTIFKERIWGGSTLASALNKNIPSGKLIGESWEICGFGPDQSIVSQGPLTGKSLGQLFNDARDGLINNYPSSTFPLLVKFLDAAANLSVQIHPDREFARAHGMGDCGKTECWYILDASEDAQLILGFKQKVSSDEIRYAIKNDSLHHLLNYVNVHPGEVYYIPAGTVHAILGGNLICEIQEPSDTTLRLYDWGRTDFSGNRRELHIEQSLQTVDLTPHNYRIEPVILNHGTYQHSYRIACRYFTIEEYYLTSSTTLRLPPKEYVRILTGLNETVTLHYPSGMQKLQRGQTILLPSVLGDVDVSGDASARFLCISVPDLKKDIVNPLLHHDIPPSLIKKLGGFEEKNDLLSLL